MRQLSKQQTSVYQATVTKSAFSQGQWHVQKRYLQDLSLSHKNAVLVLAHYVHITRQCNPYHFFIFILRKENDEQNVHIQTCAVLSYTVLIGKYLVPRIGEMGRGKDRVKSIRSAKEGMVVGMETSCLQRRVWTQSRTWIQLVHYFQERYLLKKNFEWHILPEKLAVIAHCNLQIHTCMVHCRAYISL